MLESKRIQKDGNNDPVCQKAKWNLERWNGVQKDGNNNPVWNQEFRKMEFRKMVTITLYARKQKRHRCADQSFGLCGRGQGWDDLGEWH